MPDVTLLDANGRPILPAGEKVERPRARPQAPARRPIRARYDAAQVNDESYRYLANADSLSARSANSPEVRRKLRSRARYECDENNSYAWGIVQTLANHTIGTGPRLQLNTDSRDDNARVERLFTEWAAAVCLGEKLRLMRQARAVDGEAFALFITNLRLPTGVKLDLRPIEADQVCTPDVAAWDDPYAIDGIRYDDAGNPIEYHVLPYHPGDAIGTTYTADYDRIPAELVLHWFRRIRPGQGRGVPDVTPALPLFGQLRRYTLAVLAAAETAADYAAVLQSDAPADAEELDDDSVAGETFEIERRMMTTLPAGWKLEQLRAEQPTTTHDAFVRTLMREICRCLNMPLSIAIGDSSDLNYSSGRLDHQTYVKTIEIDRAELERTALDPVFAAWLAEAEALGLVADADPAKWPRRWLWRNFEHVDPEKEAAAQEIRLRNGLTTFTDECQRDGVDPEDRVKTMAADRELFDLYDLDMPAWAAPPEPAAPAPPAEPAPSEDDPMSAARRHRAHRRHALTVRAAGPRRPDFLSFSAPAQIEAAKGDNKRPTFSILAYTGGTMNVGGFSTPVILELSGISPSRPKLPILFDHDPTRPVGQAEDIKIDASGVHLAGFITGTAGDAERIVDHAKNGFEWQASIGADVVRREFLPAGEKATVNGKEVSGPLNIIRESRLVETSFVTIGADQQTATSVAASSHLGTQNGAPSMFEQWLQAKGYDPTALTDQKRTYLKAQFDEEYMAGHRPPPAPAQAAATPPPAPATVQATKSLDEVMAEIDREESRKERITAMAREEAEMRPMMRETFHRLAAAALENGSSVKDFELALLRVRANGPSATQGTKDRKATARVVEAALCLSLKLDEPEKHFDAATLNAAGDTFKYGLKLSEFLLMAARENGFTGYSTRDLSALFDAAFARGGIRASGFSTLSVPGILSNVANKFVRDSFLAVESAWREISAIRSTTDFKTLTSYSLTGSLLYEEVGPAGEIKHGTLGELSYTNRVKTYARMLAITRQDIINDDLGALTALSRRLGRAAALKLNDVFWTAFLAGVGTFWASGNANLITGGGTVLASAGLLSGLSKFRKQTDPDGLPIAVTPRILLVPPELEITADELMTSTAVNTGGSSSTAQVPNTNVWRSKFKTVMSAYLSNSAYTNYSTTAWWLLADPNDLPTMEVAFLNGQEMPIVESADADFDQLGIQIRGYHDFGVATQEYRGSVRSAGA